MSQTPADPSPQGSQDVWSGVRWSAFASYTARVIKIAIGIVLVRLLAPEDYGLVGMALVVVGFLTVFQQLGFVQAIIHRKEINRSVMSGAFLLNLAFAIVLTTGVILCGPLIERFYNNDEVGEVTAVLSLSFIIGALGLIPSALLNREMRFDKLAIAQLGSAVAGGTVSLVMALTGWGVWALVAGTLVTTGVNVLIMFVLRPWWPVLRVDWGELRDVFRFGGYMTATQVLYYISRNAADVLIGSRLGDRALGFYRVGFGLTEYPGEMTTAVMSRVLFPAFSRLQDDDDELGRQYVRTCGITAFMSFPVLTGMLVLAHPFVAVVYGEKWLPVVPILMIFAPVGMLRSVTALVGLLYQAKGRMGLAFRWQALWSAVFVAALFCGLPWGLLGVASALAIAEFLVFVPLHWVATRIVRGLELKAVLWPLGRHVANCALMGAIVMGFRYLFEQTGVSTSVSLFSCVPIGALAYGLIVLWRRPPEIFDFLKVSHLDNHRLLPARLRR